MKKLTKNNLDSMAILLPELDEEDQRSILGGTATATVAGTTTPYPPDYTGAVPETTPYCTATTTDPYAVTGCCPTSTTCTTSTSQNPTGVYTWEDMDRMVGDGNWTGGMVEGVGYMGGVTVVTGFVSTTQSATNEQSSTVSTWNDMSNTILGMDIIDGLTNGAIEGLGDASTALEAIDWVHKAVTLYQDGQATSYDWTSLGIDALWAIGGSAGTGASIAWKIVDYETKDLQEQGKNYIVNMEAGMGKDGNYSFYKFSFGY